MIVRLFRQTAWRHWRMAPGKTILLILILGQGVGVYLAVRLANRAAVSSFQVFAERVTGQSDWLVQAPAGDLDEAWLREIRRELNPFDVTLIPVVEATTLFSDALGGGEERVYQLLGFDVFAGLDIGYQPESADVDDVNEAVRSDFWEDELPPLWLSQELATERGLGQGDITELVIHDAVKPFRVYGVVKPKNGQSLGDVLVTDLPRLQTALDRPGRIDRVEVRLEDGSQNPDQLKARLESVARSRWEVLAPETQRATGERLTSAFRFNLTILSLMALIVGLFLVHQSMDGAVVRRRGEIASLRALGMSRRTILGVWLFEALVLGLAGSVVGVLLGWGLAQWSVVAVSRTVNALYLASHADAATLHLNEAVIALCLGVLASVLACLAPAYKISRTPPAQLLHHFEHEKIKRAPPYGLFGVLAWLLGLGLYLGPPWLAGRSAPAEMGYLAALLLIVGGAFLVPVVASVMGRWRRTTASHVWTLAMSRFRRMTGRHRLTTAGLFVSIVLTGSMAVMVHSFEGTVTSWINRVLMADLYARSLGGETASSLNRIQPSTVAALAADPDIAQLLTLNKMDVRVEGREVSLQAVDLEKNRTYLTTTWIREPEADAYEANDGPATVFVSESYSIHSGKEVGDLIDLTTPLGLQTLKIRGVYAEYGNQRGSLVLERANYVAWFGDDKVMAIAAFTVEGADPNAVAQKWMRDHPTLFARANRDLRELALTVFRQTFSITYALEAIGIIVAVLGLGLALASLLLERGRELTTLRALGMARRDMAKTTALEGGALAFWGGAGGIAVSLVLGHILVFSINRNVFGWTLQYQVPWVQLGALWCLVTLIAISVSYWVGLWGADLPSEREE